MNKMDRNINTIASFKFDEEYNNEIATTGNENRVQISNDTNMILGKTNVSTAPTNKMIVGINISDEHMKSMIGTTNKMMDKTNLSMRTTDTMIAGTPVGFENMNISNPVGNKCLTVAADRDANKNGISMNKNYNHHQTKEPVIPVCPKQGKSKANTSEVHGYTNKNPGNAF